MTHPITDDDSPYDICDVCGEQAWDWPKCRSCGSVDYDWLQDQIRPHVRTLAKKDMAVLDWCEKLSELKRTGTGGWL